MSPARKQLVRAILTVLRAIPICVPIVTVPYSEVLAAAGEAATLAVDIPGQPLSVALEAFAEQTGLQLVYVSEIVRYQHSQSVAAGARAATALSAMLKGTNLRFEWLTPGSIRIFAAAPAILRSVSGLAEGPFPEVIVTATRRDEALHRVPISIEVLTSERLAGLNATTLEDFMGYLPAVSAHGVGPAQNNIYVRGLATSDFPNQAAGTNGVFPNVAIYLDEQSAQLPGRNLDVYAADLERIEVLEGPQGTLFGAGAQSGVLRYITRHPKLNVTEGEVNAGVGVTAHGRASNAVSAVINLPLITDRLSLRGVIYNDRRGGYIDNTPASFARLPSDRSIRYANYPAGCGPSPAPACQVPPNSVVVKNAALVGRDINPVTYSGLRVEALFVPDEDWNVLLAQSYQTMKADGVFTEEAANSTGEAQPPLTVQLFNRSYNKDRFENTALTVSGKIGALKLLYAGSYLVRNVDEIQDYTNYARGAPYVDYYQCVNPGHISATAQCFSPSATWRDRVRNTHLSQELRLSTPDDWRIRGVGGLFFEDYTIHDEGDWYYLTALPYFTPVGPPTGYFGNSGEFVPYPVTASNPNVRPLGDGFFNDSTRGYTQKAVFTSIDVEVIPKVLTLTAGTRYFDTRDTEVGVEATSFGCRSYDNPFPPPVNPCINHSYFVNLDSLGLRRAYSGFKSRANLSWTPNPDAMLYYTWAQGFRAGGFNRSDSAPGYSPLYAGLNSWQSLAHHNGGWGPPRAYSPDALVNNEIGWKTRWLAQRLEWNGALYQEDWTNAQIGALDSDLLGGGTLNAGNYRIRGLEMSLSARIADALTLEAAGSWNHTALVKEAVFLWANGEKIDFTQLHTESGESLFNPAGVLGSQLAVPSVRANLRARYERDLGGCRAFAQVGATYQSSSLATTDRLGLDLQGTHIAYNLPAFTSYDASIGIAKYHWLAQLNGQNLSDTHAQLFINDAPNFKAVTINRPRTISLLVSYKIEAE